MTDRFQMLLSYHYYDVGWLGRWLERLPSSPEVFADSGAFSVFTQGAQNTTQAYGQWVRHWGPRFQVVANLDVIGDPAGTWANQRTLEEMGLGYILPVFHTGEPWSWLERYLSEGYPYIALGGLVGKRLKAQMPWLIRCFRTAGDRAVFHGFGMTGWEPIRQLPFYSVDSSSWGSSYRYGQVKLFDDRIGTWCTLHLRDHAGVYAQAPLIRRYGFDPVTLATRDGYDCCSVSAMSATAWVKAAAWVRRRHGAVTVPGRTDAPDGLRLYLADTDPGSLTAANLWLGGHVRDPRRVREVALPLMRAVRLGHEPVEVA